MTDARVFTSDDLSDGIREVHTAAKAGIGFHDRHLAARLGHEKIARIDDPRRGITDRQEQEVNGRIDDRSLRHVDERPVFYHGRIQRRKSMVLDACILPQVCFDDQSVASRRVAESADDHTARKIPCD